MVKKQKNLGFTQFPPNVFSVVHESFVREFPSLYDETMSLMSSLHDVENKSKELTDGLTAPFMTKFMHVVCWILLYRSFLDSEIGYQQLQIERAKINLTPIEADDSEKESWGQAAKDIAQIVSKVYRIHMQLIEAEQKPIAVKNPVAQQLEQLQKSFQQAK